MQCDRGKLDIKFDKLPFIIPKQIAIIINRYADTWIYNVYMYVYTVRIYTTN